MAAEPAWLPVLFESVVVWSVTSGVPLAAVEYDCRATGRSVVVRPLPWLDARLRKADWSGDELRLHFHYDPCADGDRLYDELSGGGEGFAES